MISSRLLPCSFIKPEAMSLTRLFYALVILFALTCEASQAGPNMVIAKNGGSKDLIENSLPAATFAAAMGAEFLELPVVMTADGQVVVFHDLTLDRLTDVAEMYPNRKREDGFYHIIDFTLEELSRLHMQDAHERYESPLSLGISTLTEQLGLLRRLETLLKRQLGIVLEIRQPRLHLQVGKDISSATLDTLAGFGYTTAQSKLYLQCFDPDELQRIQSLLMPERQMSLPLIQLVGENDGLETRQGNQENWQPYSYDWLYTNSGLRMVASYAVAITLPTKVIADLDGNLPLAEYVGEAHRLGLMVLAKPLDLPSRLPSFAADFQSMIDFYFSKAGIDGVYTDSFADVQNYIRQKSEKMTVPLPPLDAEQPTPNEQEEMLQGDLPPFFRNLNLSRPTPADTLKTESGNTIMPEKSE